MALEKCPRCGGQIMKLDQTCLQCGADYRPPTPQEVYREHEGRAPYEIPHIKSVGTHVRKYLPDDEEVTRHFGVQYHYNP